jgi:radical SAM protein with 4Fe4S-binding SPASM domain
MIDPLSLFRPAYPYHMVWLATNACNARCKHCSSSSTTRAPDELSTREVMDLVDQLAAVGVVDMAVSGGEPLLRRDLFDIISHMRRRGMAVGVGSNGSVITAARAAALAGCGVGRVQVSLDGLEHAHDRLRCWPGLFQRAVSGIGRCLEAGLRTHVCCTINRFNAGELPAFVELVLGLGVKRINFSRYVPTGRKGDDLDLDDEEWFRSITECQRLRERYRERLEIVTHLAQQTLVDPEIEDMPGFIGCQAGIGQGCITANGTVYPCVLLPLAVGNIRERAFAEIWTGAPLLQALRDRENLHGRCHGCSHRSRCAGCRAVAYARTGDAFAEDPRCWLDAAGQPARAPGQAGRAAEPAQPLVQIRRTRASA